MNTTDVHANLAKDILGGHPSDDDALALMVLLHTHRIRLEEPILSDRPGVMELAAITRHHAAEVLAQAWPDRADGQRTDRGYWYFQFNTRTPCEVAEDVPPVWMTRVQRLYEKLNDHSVVAGLQPED